MESLATLCIMLLLILTVAGYEEDEKLFAELEICDLELQDDFDNLSKAIKLSILNNNPDEELKSQQIHGKLMKLQAKNLQQYENIPAEANRNWTILTKPGDVLLEDENWTNLVTFCVSNKTKSDFNMETPRNSEVLKENWLTRHNFSVSKQEKFLSILDLVNKAAALNGKEDAKSYWEMLEDQENIYEKSETLWLEIKPLYLQLHQFVKNRIFNFYNITNNSSKIPVHLLGSNFGDDWSYIADLVLPHPQLHYDVKTYIKNKRIEDLYKLGEELAQQLSLGKFGNQFWSNSFFNLTWCPNRVVSYCFEGYSEILTCNATSWTEYLNIFENSIKIALRNNDYYSLPRLNLRYSPIDEAIISLGEILAINNLPFNGVSKEEDESNKMTKLLLTALRVLPKLPYYLAVDKWRIQELGNKSENVNEAWWKIREELQGVTYVSKNGSYVADFLGDSFATTNQPYLHKFLGPILQFQILEYYKSSMYDPESNVALEIGKDENFLAMIQNRPINDWSYLINMYYGIYEISTSSLLEYFKPLADYLDNAPLEQQKIVTTTARPTTQRTTIKTTIRNKKVESVTKNNDTINDAKRVTVTGSTADSSSGKTVMYVGIGLLVVVVVIVFANVINKKVKKRRRTNNRRFET